MNSCMVWSTYLELGAQAYKTGHSEIADMMLKAALQELPSQQDKLDEALYALENIADQLVVQKSYVKAEKLYKRLKSLVGKKHPPDSSHICRLLYKLAELYILDNRFAVAKRAFAHAYLLTKKSNSVKPSEHVEYLSRLTDRWNERARTEEASRVYNELLAIRATANSTQ